MIFIKLNMIMKKMNGAINYLLEEISKYNILIYTYYFFIII
jgi:hypothetical protein